LCPGFPSRVYPPVEPLFFPLSKRGGFRGFFPTLRGVNYDPPNSRVPLFGLYGVTLPLFPKRVFLGPFFLFRRLTLGFKLCPDPFKVLVRPQFFPFPWRSPIQLWIKFLGFSNPCFGVSPLT